MILLVITLIPPLLCYSLLWTLSLTSCHPGLIRIISLLTTTRPTRCPWGHARTNTRHPADEQLGHVDTYFFSNYLICSLSTLHIVLYLVHVLHQVRSPWSAVRSPRFIYPVSRGPSILLDKLGRGRDLSRKIGRRLLTGYVLYWPVWEIKCWDLICERWITLNLIFPSMKWIKRLVCNVFRCVLVSACRFTV